MAHGPKRICYTLRSIVVQYGEEVVSSLSVISYRHRGSLLGFLEIRIASAALQQPGSGRHHSGTPSFKWK